MTDAREHAAEARDWLARRGSAWSEGARMD